MPCYDFQCRLCKHTFETFLSIRQFERQKTRQKCPLCNERCDHLMSAPVPVRTASRFLSRHGTLLDQFGDTPTGRAQLRDRIAAAKEAGYTPSMNDVYDPTVASSPGAPEGFIPADDPKGHMQRVMAERGVGCQGGICPTPTGPGKEPPNVPLAESIVQDEMARQIQNDPGLASKKEQLREEIIDRHSYKRR